MNALRLWIETTRILVGNIAQAARGAVRRAYKASHFRLASSATVLSGDVSLAARIGHRVHIAKSVTVFPGVAIGDYTAVNQGCLIESGTIGKFCSLAADVAIGMEEHPMHHLSTHVATYAAPQFGLITAPKPNPQKKPEPAIGNDVWIARAAIILRGVSIGDGAVIAAGAVVTRDVPPYAVVAGCPARVLRFRFDADQIEALLRRRWWDDESFIAQGFARHGIGLEAFETELFATDADLAPDRQSAGNDRP